MSTGPSSRDNRDRGHDNSLSTGVGGRAPLRASWDGPITNDKGAVAAPLLAPGFVARPFVYDVPAFAGAGSGAGSSSHQRGPGDGSNHQRGPGGGGGGGEAHGVMAPGSYAPAREAVPAAGAGRRSQPSTRLW